MDAETAPLSDPGLYRYEIDTAEVAELWRRGSVVASWLLDLTAEARLLKLGKRLATGEVTIRSDGEDEPVAHVTSTYSIPPQEE